MQYIAALDYEHLDNGIFLSSLAKSISQQKEVRPIIIHGDSKYTERVIQTGVMREDAVVRSIKDLNHRLIALFADEGISTIGINGYQREFISIQDDKISMDKKYFNSLPEEPALLISTLVLNRDHNQPQPISLTRLATFLRSNLPAEQLFVFSRSDSDEIMKNNELNDRAAWKELEKSFIENKIPEEFHRFNEKMNLTTAQHFHKVPSLESTMQIS
ncbi:MAG: hypothetical protein U5J95_05290 [Balneolaceae bacterium]|nr:hypothetical protein [Balneolaceae bacterium]